MLDTLSIWQVNRAPGLPVDQLVLGKSPEEVAALLPRLFNLCRAAQETAARQALRLDPAPADLAQEIMRDHLMKLCVTWPRLLGLAPLPLPAGWQSGGAALLTHLFEAPFPDTPEAFEAALLSRRGIAPVLVALSARIAPGTGRTPVLPEPTAHTAFAIAPVENSVAGRQADHPVMRTIEETRGRDLFWRAIARLYDLADAATGLLPAPEAPAPGTALVPATRGTYAVRATVSDGTVTAFTRITPTDHLLADGGILDHALRNIAPEDGLLPLVLDILDPCSPIEINEVPHA